MVAFRPGDVPMALQPRAVAQRHNMAQHCESHAPKGADLMHGATNVQEFEFWRWRTL